MTADLLAAAALLGAAVVVAAIAAGVGMILGGRLDARLEREEEPRD